MHNYVCNDLNFRIKKSAEEIFHSILWRFSYFTIKIQSSEDISNYVQPTVLLL